MASPFVMRMSAGRWVVVAGISAAHPPVGMCAPPSLLQNAGDAAPAASEPALLMSQESGSAIADRVPFTTAPGWRLQMRRDVRDIQIADMNGDTLPDLVIACAMRASIPSYDAWRDMILYNQGEELEPSPTWVSEDEIPSTRAIVGNIDADEFPDLVLIHGGALREDVVHVHFGSPEGPSPSPGYRSVVLGGASGTGGALLDVDLDGDQELVTSNRGPGGVNQTRPVMLFDNTGSTLTPGPVWVSAESSVQNAIVAADFNDDGWPDVGVATSEGWRSGIYFNVGGALDTHPGWVRDDVYDDGRDTDISSADIDMDGRPDLAISGDEYTRWHNEGEGGFGLSWRPGYQNEIVRFADIDGDGDQDAMELITPAGISRLFLNIDGTISRRPAWEHHAPQFCTAVAFGDLNNDGICDVAIGYDGTPCVRVFYGACPGDLDGDLDSDPDDIALFSMNFVDGIVGNADIDGDGDEDADDIFAFVDLFVSPCPRDPG